MQRNPLDELISLRSTVDRVIAEATAQFSGSGRTFFPVDVMETNNGYRIRASLPGVRPEDVQIDVSGHTVSIKGEQREHTDQHDQDQRYLVREHHNQTYSRTITLPVPVNPDSATASLEHGILTIVLVRQAENHSRRISITGTTSLAANEPTTPGDRGGLLSDQATPAEDAVDEGSAESFPASDPPSTSSPTTATSQ